MSWSYSGNPQSSAVDECRFLIGDTCEKAPIMQDEEIEYLIGLANGNKNKLLYELFSHAATVFSRDIKRSLGPQSEDPTKRLEYFNAQADFYKKRISAAGVSVPRYAYPKVFGKGMHSNPPWRHNGGGA